MRRSTLCSIFAGTVWPPVRNEQEQSDAPDDREDRTIVEDGRMTDPIPKHSGNETGHEL
jgi:hypothetical protein